MRSVSTIVQVLAASLLLALPAVVRAQHANGVNPKGGDVHGPESPQLDPAQRRHLADGGMKFTENRGQIVDVDGHARPEVLFTANWHGSTVYLEKDRVIYQFRELIGNPRYFEDAGEYRHELADAGDPTGGIDPQVHYHRIDMELVGANPNVQVASFDGTQGYENYYLPQCPDGLTGVRSWRRLVYQDVYPHVDMVVNASAEGAKIDFIVHPYGNVSDIKMRYVGADKVGLLPDATIRVESPIGFIQAAAPYSYQNAGVWPMISSNYHLNGSTVTFDVNGYDRTQDLVIDPFQLWATYYGANGSDQLMGGDPTEVDRKGNVFVAGYTSTAFPIVTQPGGYTQAFAGGDDAFLVKISADGRLRWATIIGGNGDDLAHGIATDPQQNVLIAGHTFSTNFPRTLGPVTWAGVRDAMLAKFDSNGVRLWSRYYGGSQFDDGYGFAIDSLSNPAMLSTTQSNGLQTIGTGTRGNYDAIVTKFDPNGNPLWAQYFGGSQEDYGYAAATDNVGNIIITGYTYSTSTTWPMTPGCAQSNKAGAAATADAFVVKLTSNGTLRWSTYYGGAGTENNDATAIAYCGLATNVNGDIYLGGTTYTVAPAGNPGFPTVGGVFEPAFRGGTNPNASDAYIVKFDSNGAVTWATYVGGDKNDFGTGVASNASGGVLITGFTATNDVTFPVTTVPQAAYQFTHAGGTYDAFIVKLDGAGVQRWGTYFGGAGDDRGEGISFDPYGSIMLGGQTTTTAAGVTPFAFSGTLNPVIQNGNGGGIDAFLTVFCDPDPAPIDSSGPHKICDGDTLRLWVRPGYSGVKWYRRNPTPPGPDNEVVPFRGKDTIVLSETGKFYALVQNAGGCLSSTDTLDITKLARINPVIAPASPALLCTGDTLTLTINPVSLVVFSWIRLATGDTVSRVRNCKVTVGGTYACYVIDNNNCRDSQQVVVNEYPKPTPITAAKDTAICEDDNFIFSTTGGTGGNIAWYKQGTPTAVGAGPTYSTNKAGTYFAISTSAVGCTAISNVVNLKVNKKPRPKIVAITPASFCEGDSCVLDVSGTAGDALRPPTNVYDKYQWSTGATTHQIVVRQTMDLTVIVTDTNGCVGQSTISVTKNPKPKPKLAWTPDTVICEGDTVTISTDGSYNGYAWNNGSTDRSIKVARSATYWVTVTTTEGCPGNSDSVHITVRPRPVAKISGAAAVCTNTLAQYSVPSAPGVTYSWQLTGPSGTIASGAGTNTLDVNWGASGNNKVIVVVTDQASGCKAYDTLNVKVGSILVPNITPSRSPQLCPGDSVILDAGPGYASYDWSTGEKSRTIVVKTAGVFTVTVASAGGCSGTSDPFNVTIATPPVPKITPSRSLQLCPGDTVELAADAGYTEYLWNNGASIQKLKIARSGTFFVTVTDTNGCRGVSDSVVVVLNPPPAPVITGPNSVCINSADDYNATGNPGDTYQWKIIGVLGTIQSGQGTGAINILWSTAGDDTIEVTVTDGKTGCTGTVQYAVNISTTLKPVITPSRLRPFCDSDSMTLAAPAGYKTYLWSPGGETTPSITVKTPGTYDVTVTDAGGCSGSGSITVSQKPPIVVAITPNPTAGFCPGDSVLLTAPAGYSEYLWSPNGETTPTIYAKAAGAYTVTVMDADSCRGTSAAVNVSVNPLPVLTGIIQNGDDLTADVDSVGGPKIAGYQWFENGAPIVGGTGVTYHTFVVDDYSVRVTSVDGCVITSAPYRPTAAASSQVELPVISAAPGERVLIPLSLTSSTNLERNKVSNFEAKLRFNKTLLIPKDASVTSVIDNNDRVITITGARSLGASTGDLIRIEFLAALGDADQTPLKLESFKWLDTQNGVTLVTLVDGQFKLNNVCPSGGERLLDLTGATGLKVVRPNPTGGVTEIDYEVAERGNTRVSVVDLIGREVAVLVDAQLAPGRYLVPVDVSQWSSGMYVVVLQTPTERFTQIMQVVK